MDRSSSRLSRRTLLKGTVATTALAGAAVYAPAVVGQAKSPYAGTRINGAAFQSTFFEYLKNYFPEFKEKTGIEVQFDTQAFPVYNQRTDLELSTKGSALDVINVTFIYSGRWIGAGWVTNLDQFLKDPNATPPDWDPGDFVAGAQSSLQDAKGSTYGFGWEAGAMIMAASRADLIEKTGLKLPTNFEELVNVCEAVHNKDGVAAFTADKLHHWNWIPYLMGMGGKVFKDPPANLTPVLDTPEAAKSAQWYADLLTKYGP